MKLKEKIRRWRLEKAMALLKWKRRLDQRTEYRLRRSQGIPGEALIRAAAKAHGPDGERPTREFKDLPSEYATESMLEIKRDVVARLDDIMLKAPVLTRSELHVIGALVQLFAKIENELHFCRSLFCRSGHLSQSDREKSSRDTLFKQVRKGVRALEWHANEEKQTLDALTHIKRLMAHRDVVAHFEARLDPSTKSIVFFSNRCRDFVSINGELGDPMEISFSILMIEDLTRIAQETDQLTIWMINFRANLFRRLFPDEVPTD